MKTQFFKITILLSIITGTFVTSTNLAQAQSLPSIKDIFEVVKFGPIKFFKANIWWYVGQSTIECVYSYAKGDGNCAQNPNFKLTKVSYDDVVRNSTIPCYEGYNYIADVGNQYTRKKSLKFVAYTPQNKVFVFSN
jgi:hypothetical protein